MKTRQQQAPLLFFLIFTECISIDFGSFGGFEDPVGYNQSVPQGTEPTKGSVSVLDFGKNGSRLTD